MLVCNVKEVLKLYPQPLWAVTSKEQNISSRERRHCDLKALSCPVSPTPVTEEFVTLFDKKGRLILLLKYHFISFKIILLHKDPGIAEYIYSQPVWEIPPSRKPFYKSERHQKGIEGRSLDAEKHILRMFGN